MFSKWRLLALTGFLSTTLPIVSGCVETLPKAGSPSTQSSVVSGGPQQASSGSGGFEVISSVAAVPAAATSQDAASYLARIQSKPVTNDHGGGVEYLHLVGGHYVGCWFPSDGGLKRAVQKGKGLLAPVFVNSLASSALPGSSDILVDWAATEALHSALSGTLKLKLLPVSSSRAYWRSMEKYANKLFQSDVNRYLTISKSGGGIIGQIIGAARDKDGAYSATNDPNVRFGGLYREDFHREVLQQFDGIDFLVTANNAALLETYYSGLAPAVYAKQDKESLALNLQKDMAGHVQAAKRSALYYYFGTYDDQRGFSSSATSVVLSSAVRVNVHQRLEGEGYTKFRTYLELYKVMRSLNEVLDALKSAYGVELSISPIERYRDVQSLGVDKARVFCGAYDKKISDELLEISSKGYEITEFSELMSNPLGFTFGGGLNINVDKAVRYTAEVKGIIEKIESMRSSGRAARARAVNVLVRNGVLPAFRSQLYTGFISSQKIQ